MKKSYKIWLAITGILLIALGVMCIIKPGSTLFATAWLIGCFTLFSGIAKLVFTFKTQSFMPNSGTRMLSGLFQVIIGLIFLSHNMFVTMSLPLVFILWVMFEGVILAVVSFDYKKFGFSSWWLMLILGIAIVILCIFGLRNLDVAYDVAGKTLTLLIGISIIILGLAHLFALTGIKRVENYVKELGEAYKG